MSPMKEFFSDPREEALKPGEFSRRDFLKLMGISTVLAGAAACTRRPVERIIPYLNKPEEVTPGEALWYASTSMDCHCQCGVLVKTREGRPIKLEGNPDHPVNRGGLCARAQTSVWNLYDPDRLRTPVLRDRAKGSTAEAGWDPVDQQIREAFAQINAKRGRVRLLTGATGGPATQQLIGEFVAAQTDGRHIVYEPVNTDEIAQAHVECFGRFSEQSEREGEAPAALPLEGATRAPGITTPRYRFDRADVVVTLGADFLGTWISPVEFARDWAAGRKLNGDGKGRMSRLIVLEPILTLTGTNADERYPVKPTDLVAVALALAAECGGTPEMLKPFALNERDAVGGVPAAALKRIAQALASARGRSLIVAGLLTGEQGIALQVAVNYLNSLLGNYGQTIDVSHGSRQAPGVFADLQTLIDEMNAGTVDALIVSGVNPVYNLPIATRFIDGMKKVPLVIQMTDRVDETSAMADIVLPVSHFLESWGDAEPQTGVYSIVQPTIAPLYLTRTLAANLIAWMNGAAVAAAKGLVVPPEKSPEEYWYEYLRATWRERIYPTFGASVSFEAFWESCLRTGAVEMRGEAQGGAGAFNTEALARATRVSAGGPADGPVGPQLVGYPTVAQYDGRYANNSWLQELPDPVTKITWDNYVCLAPRTAKRLGLEEEDVIALVPPQSARVPAEDPERYSEKLVELPVHIQPGTHEDVVAVPIGYGRTAAGRVGNGVGAFVHDLAQVRPEGIAWAGLPVSIAKTGKRHRLATTQGHQQLMGRPIIQETTFEEYRKNPHAGADDSHWHDGAPPSMWAKHKYEGRRWGMAIDLNSCTGCSACVVACQVENNIPAVGKKQILKGREMHWLRIDRYYSPEEENPNVVHQPMLCQHCEKAPCETVCPVLATVHDNEGLNLQVYNRCVGTRYCSNNCPYKVRRFNWFDYGNKNRAHYVWQEPLHLMLNPDVTVREKGIMEKCTFCIQRIRKGKEDAKAKGIEVADGAIKTACQQSCPTDAIVFGDMNDPESRVAKLKKDPR
ncbi:MAG: 4Fe-4S dicluster domain-containing protein [Deltaproteobacteria bacterium]|nr:4Fe-4S dicluster domain-containing protein [Deltaproteobacteria bacterium]